MLIFLLFHTMRKILVIYLSSFQEKYLDHLEESTYEVLDDTRSYVVADVKAETRKRKSPTRYDRNKSSEGQNQTKRIRFLEKESKKGKRVSISYIT